MKHLSRVLSLALVIALSLGLVVTAGAAVTEYENYTDAADIKDAYLEATDVLTALSIFQGNEDNSLRPEGTFTRAQAAKIATYISIGATAAERLSPRLSKFTDVSTSYWANKYIEYAAEKNIVNGVSSVRFNPEGAVTGAQLAKMLLVALGYGANNEYIGPSWELNAIVDGQKRGILTIDTNYSEPAKREEAIQYVFNTIRSDNPFGKNYLVKYSTLINDYVLANGSTWAIGDTGTAQFLGTETFGLTSKPVTDDYGRSGHIWTLPMREITDYYQNGMKIATSTNGTILQSAYPLYSKYSLTDDASPNYIADLQDSEDGIPVAAFINGVKISSNLLAGVDTVDPITGLPVLGAISKANTSSDRTGVIVELWDTTYDGKIDQVIIIEKQVGTITSAPSVNSTTNYVTIGGVTPEPVAATKIDYPTGLVRDDVVLTHTDKNGVLHIELAKTITGSITRASNNLEDGVYRMSLTLGGEIYRETQLRDVFDDQVTHFDFVKFANEQENYGIDATGYLDDNNNIVAVVLNDTGDINYLYMLDNTLSGYVASARVVLADGTLKTVTVSRVDGDPVDTTIGGTFDAGTQAPKELLYTYSINSNGGYDIRKIKTGYEFELKSNSNTNSAADIGGIWRSAAFNGAAGNTFTVTINGTPTNKPLIADSKTVFIVETDPNTGGVTGKPLVYRAYTGYASVPTYSEVNSSNVLSRVAVGNNYVAKVVYISSVGVAGTSKQIASYAFFIDIAASYFFSQEPDGTFIYRVPAIVDNKYVPDLKVDRALFEDRISANGPNTRGSNLGIVTYDDDVVVSFDTTFNTTTVARGTGTTKSQNYTVGLSNYTFGYTDASRLFIITYNEDRVPTIQGAPEAPLNDIVRGVNEIGNFRYDDWFVQPPASTAADVFDIGTLFIVKDADTAGNTAARTTLLAAETTVVPSGAFASAATAVTSLSTTTELGVLQAAIGNPAVPGTSAATGVLLQIDSAQAAINNLATTNSNKTVLQVRLDAVKATVLAAQKKADDSAVILFDESTVTQDSTAAARTAIVAEIKYGTIVNIDANFVWANSPNLNKVTVTLNNVLSKATQDITFSQITAS
jgi:hypothetical protein